MFDELPTEAWNAASADLDLRSTAELVELMSAEDASVPLAVERARVSIATAIDAVVTSEACGFAKPDPRIVLRALDALAVTPAAPAAPSAISAVGVTRGTPQMGHTLNSAGHTR